MNQAEAMQHGASFDVEDYRQILRRRWSGDSGPVGDDFLRDMEALCAMLDETGTKATFFVTGTVATAKPELLRQWQGMGHEIACHGWDHVPIWQMDRAGFKADLTRAKKAAEDATGQAVVGYRAPVFSIRWDTMWALDVLAECGFVYDSSIVPVRTKRYGLDGFARQPEKYVLPEGGKIVEFPLPVAKLLGRMMPVGGGGYFRLLPLGCVLKAVEQNQREGITYTLYCHPDEVGGRKFRAADLVDGVSAKLRARLLEVRSNLGRGGMARIVREVLRQFRFTRLAGLADRVNHDRTERILGTSR